MKVGFVGVGTMGRPMVEALATKGFGVVAFDVVPATLAKAAEFGAVPAGSAAETARRSHVVVTMLPSSSHVEQAYLGPAGILEGAAPGQLCIDMSTIDPRVSRHVAHRLTERGIRFVDAPASGSATRAAEGTLTVMVGGGDNDVADARPVLAALATTVIHVGEVGSGAIAKLCNNLIAGVAMVAVSEAFRIADASGVDLRILTDVISRSTGDTWIMQHCHPVPDIVATSAASRGYVAGFATDLIAKDLALAVEVARQLRVPVVVAPAAQQLLRLASSHGYGDRDFSVVYSFLKPSSDQAPV